MKLLTIIISKIRGFDNWKIFECFNAAWGGGRWDLSLLLCPDGHHLALFFHRWHSFTFFERTILPGRSGNNISNCLTVDSIVSACYFNYFK